MNSKNNLLAAFSLVSLVAVTGMAHAEASQLKANKINQAHTLASSTSNGYHSYVEVGGTRFFKTKGSKSAFSYDFFMPLWQSTDQGKLLFGDVRLYDRSGTPFEGNIHVGYRYLSPEKDYLYGIYTAFDRNRSAHGNYFNQITLGLEGWFQKIFLGGNVYMPIGNQAQFINPYEGIVGGEVKDGKIGITFDGRQEKALGGADIAVGYEFIPGLVGKIGGYYFGASGVETIYGPRATLAYDWMPSNGKKVLNVFDKFGWEVGVQKDQVRGTACYLSAKFRIGLSKDSNNHLQGVARHMVDLVHRDVDIVSNSGSKVHTVSMPNMDKNGQEILPAGVKLYKDGQIMSKDGVLLGKHSSMFDSLLKLWHDFNKNGSQHGEHANKFSKEVQDAINKKSTNSDTNFGDSSAKKPSHATCGVNDAQNEKIKEIIAYYRSEHPESATQPDSYVYGLAINNFISKGLLSEALNLMEHKPSVYSQQINLINQYKRNKAAGKTGGHLLDRILIELRVAKNAYTWSIFGITPYNTYDHNAIR